MRHKRHTFGTEMLRAGVSVPAFMHMLGHTDPKRLSSTRNYSAGSSKRVQLARQTRHLALQANRFRCTFLVRTFSVSWTPSPRPVMTLRLLRRDSLSDPLSASSHASATAGQHPCSAPATRSRRIIATDWPVKRRSKTRMSS